MGLRSLTIGALCLASSVVARTDIAGCTSFDTVTSYPGGQAFATRIWYVPDTGELCELLDCGGGRAPPKTTVPGCAAYQGTETYSPKFINPKTLGHVPATSTQGGATTTADSPSTLITTAASASSASSAAITTGAPVTTNGPETTETGSDTAKVTAKVTVTPSASASSGAPGTNSTKPVSTTASTAAAAGLPTAGAMLGSLMLAGVAAGLGMF